MEGTAKLSPGMTNKNDRQKEKKKKVKLISTSTNHSTIKKCYLRVSEKSMGNGAKDNYVRNQINPNSDGK